MMMTISNLIAFLKALPPNAVYSSQEPPPEGTKTLYTNQDTPYWLRERTARPWATTAVGTHVLENVDKDSSILDFGAGHGKQTTRLKNEGFKNVTAYDTHVPKSAGEDSPTTTDKDVLQTKYDVVMAGNVLNVQSNDKELDDTLKTMTNVLSDNGKIIANFPETPRKHDDFQTVESMKEKLTNHFSNVERIGGTSKAPIYELSNPVVQKSWITNPRGSADVKNKTVRKEGGDGGGFGDGGGVAFTSTDAGIFTPTHSERERKPKKKDKSGIGRLADFLTDNSPERKMAKGDTTIVDLINWVKLEMRKEDRAGFHQQTSGETINNQPPRIDWERDKHKVKVEAEDSSLLEEKNPVEFDAEPDKTAAQQQEDDERRIRSLDDPDDKRPAVPQSTGSASQAAPAGLNIRLGWESGGYDSDELSTGGDKDKKQGKVKDPVPKLTSEEVLQNLIKEIESSLP